MESDRADALEACQALVSEKAAAKRGSRTFLKAGTKVTVETLIKGMIIQSGNDAAIALAEHIAGEVDKGREAIVRVFLE